MLFSQTSEYALRAITHLADRAGEVRSSRMIAESVRTSPGYLADVMQLLVKAGLVSSKRGQGGGFVLAKPADQITILDVINAVDPIEQIDVCPLGLKSHGHHLCPLHGRLNTAIALVESTFASASIAQILAEPCASRPLVDDVDETPGS